MQRVLSVSPFIRIVRGTSASRRGASSIAGTAPFYQRHVFVATSSPFFAWDSNCTTPTKESTLERLQKEVVLKTRTTANAIPVKLTLFQTPQHEASTTISSDELMVFPDRVIFPAPVDISHTAQLLVSPPLIAASSLSSLGSPSPHAQPGVKSLADELHFFVCCHTTRDKRCGDCGPPILEALQQEIQASGDTRTHVWPCSHVGGHEHAANLLVYPPGDWYGRVDRSHVSDLLSHYAYLRSRMSAAVKSTEALSLDDFPPLLNCAAWRGRMSVSKAESLKKAAGVQSAVNTADSVVN